MPDKLNDYTKENTDTGQAHKPNRPGLKYALYLFGLAVLTVVVYQLVFMVRLTAGMSSEKPAPKHIVTVEIINASGIPQISQEVSEKFKGLKNNDVLVTVVNAERLDYKEIENSLVISRDENTELAALVAEMVGIDRSEVVYRPLIESDLSPMVTLVLGEDIRQLLNPQKSIKES